MRIRLELVDVRLDGDFDEESGRTEELEFTKQVKVDFVSQSLALGPLETKHICLRARPHCVGVLRLRRVLWNFGQVMCQRNFIVKGRRLRNTVEQRAARSGVYSLDLRFELRVRPQMPEVSIMLENWPSLNPLILGELHPCTLVISRRQGSCEVAFLSVTCSHPAFVSFASGSASSSANSGKFVHEGAVQDEFRVPVTLRAAVLGQHRIRFCALAEAKIEGSPDVKGKNNRQWITVEQSLIVHPSLSCSVTQTPSFQEVGKVMFSCTMENRAFDDIAVNRVRCFTRSQELILTECVPCGSPYTCLKPGHQFHTIFSLQTGTATEMLSSEEDPVANSGSSFSAVGTRNIFLEASRVACGVPGAELLAQHSFDLVVEWHTIGEERGRNGEIFILKVMQDRPNSLPCPLTMHILAPSSVVLQENLVIPVSVCVRNTSNVGAVSFQLVADAAHDFIWLGSERSEVLNLPPLASCMATFQAYFPLCGVFNLNRFRFFVVGMEPGAGTVPVTEQSPLTFGISDFEKFIHVKRDVSMFAACASIV